MEIYFEPESFNFYQNSSITCRSTWALNVPGFFPCLLRITGTNAGIRYKPTTHWIILNRLSNSHPVYMQTPDYWCLNDQQDSFFSIWVHINSSLCLLHSQYHIILYIRRNFPHRKKAKVGGAPYTRVQQNPTFIFSVIRSRMLPQFISDAKDKHPTFIFTVIQSGMLPRFISDAKDKHPTFIFTVIRSGMLPRFISDAKDKHPTFIFTVIRSRMLPRFISDAKDKHPTFIFAVIRSRIFPSFIMDYCSKCWEIHSQKNAATREKSAIFFFLDIKSRGAPYTRVRRIYEIIRYTLFPLPFSRFNTPLHHIFKSRMECKGTLILQAMKVIFV